MTKKLSQATRILNLLDKSGKPVTAATIASRLKIELGNVHKRIHDLRNQGFDIESNPRTRDGVRTVAYSL
jgi:biotin operon repressor